MQLQALRGQHDVRHARQQRQRVQRAGDTRVALLLEFGRHGAAVRHEQINDRIDQRARVEDARIDDVLQCRLRTSMCRTTCWRATPARASGADRQTTARPSRRRRPNRSSSTCAPPTQRWQHAPSAARAGRCRASARRGAEYADTVRRATWRRQTGRTRRQTAPTTPTPAPHTSHCRRRASCRRAAEHDVMHSLRRCRHAHRQRRPHAPHTDGIAF
jgi:hypothetical protein